MQFGVSGLLLLLLLKIGGNRHLKTTLKSGDGGGMKILTPLELDHPALLTTHNPSAQLPTLVPLDPGSWILSC